jgi:hypothetical protein
MARAGMIWPDGLGAYRASGPVLGLSLSFEWHEVLEHGDIALHISRSDAVPERKRNI